MMKSFKFNVAITLFVLAVSHATGASAATSGTGNNGDFSWTCRSLAVSTVPGFRLSGCFADSPSGNLKRIYIQTSIAGQAVWNVGNSSGYPPCAPAAGSPYADSDTDEDESIGGGVSSVSAEWYMQISEFSFNDTVNGYGEWERATWTPPEPETGGGSVGPFWNVSGHCW